MTTTDTTGFGVSPLAGWNDGIEASVRERIRGFIEELLEEELATALGRGRYERKPRLPVRAVEAEGLGDEESATHAPPKGHRHGKRERTLTGTFGAVSISVPRARIETADGSTTEWTNRTLPAYRRRTKEIEAVIAGAYLSGTNTRRVGRALAGLFRSAVSKDTVSRAWRKIKSDWDAWNRRSLAGEDVVRRLKDAGIRVVSVIPTVEHARRMEAEGVDAVVASGTEAYYSFDYGNIHFICLDSHDLDRKPTAAMGKWLKTELEKSKADWLIAFWHHPAYTKGSHDSDKEADLTEVRKYIMPIIEAAGFSDRPPESKHTPLPTSATGFWAFGPFM